MNGLLPIIRRARRPLYPPDDPAPAVPPAVVEPPPLIPPLIPLVETPVESAPVEAAEVVVSAAVEPVPPVVVNRKRTKRVENPPA